MRIYAVKQVFRFLKGIRLHRKSRKIRFFLSEKTYFTSYVRNMFYATILYKYHGYYQGQIILMPNVITAVINV